MKRLLFIGLIVLCLFLVSCVAPVEQGVKENIKEDVKEVEGVIEENKDVVDSGDVKAVVEDGTVSKAVEGQGNVSISSRKCTAGWRCISSKIKAYQNEDCTFGSKKTCTLGCSNDECLAGNVCVSGFKCLDNSTQAFQNEDCSWDKTITCELGCANAECVKPVIVSNGSSLNSTSVNIYVVENKTSGCFEGSKCFNSEYKVFQYSNCVLGAKTFCANGCEKGSCKN